MTAAQKVSLQKLRSLAVRALGADATVFEVGLFTIIAGTPLVDVTSRGRNKMAARRQLRDLLMRLANVEAR